ncbi:MAG: hypothetical protein HYT98_00960 [Candidatus Sungbacteria bacterium]|nr:hypothetical protein [Candidatus Sungbacteria bacterium]
MKESSKKFEKNEPEEGWKVGISARLENWVTIPGRLGNKDCRVAPGTVGKIKQIGGSVQDLLVEFVLPDGNKVDAWLNFHEISPLKTIEETEASRTNAWLSYDEAKPANEENKDELEENSSNLRAA